MDFNRIVVVSVVLGIPLLILFLLNVPEMSFKRAVIATVLIIVVIVLGFTLALSHVTAD